MIASVIATSTAATTAAHTNSDGLRALRGAEPNVLPQSGH
jgi:hypothetical protein